VVEPEAVEAGAPESAAADATGAPGTESDAADATGIPETGPLAGLTLPDLEGTSRPLRARPGEVTLVNFWATWCLPCLRELPELVELHRRWAKDGLHVVGVAVESGAARDIRDFADEKGMEYTLLTADQRWAREHFGVFGLPVTIVVDRAGEIQHTLIGPQTEEAFEAALRPLLGPSGGAGL